MQFDIDVIKLPKFASGRSQLRVSRGKTGRLASAIYSPSNPIRRIVFRIFLFLYTSLFYSSETITVKIHTLGNFESIGIAIMNSHVKNREIVGVSDRDGLILVQKQGAGNDLGLENEILNLRYLNLQGGRHVPEIAYSEISENELILVTNAVRGKKMKANNLSTLVKIRDFLKEQKITHGDLTPWNVILNLNDDFTLIDWELSERSYKSGYDLGYFFARAFKLLPFQKNVIRKIIYDKRKLIQYFDDDYKAILKQFNVSLDALNIQFRSISSEVNKTRHFQGIRTSILAMQLVSSLGNALLLFAMSYWSRSNLRLDQFAFAFITYSLLLSLFRSMVGEPLLVERHISRLNLDDYFSASISFIACSSALISILWLLPSQRDNSFLICLLVGIPFLLLADVFKYLALVNHKDYLALYFEILWTVSFACCTLFIVKVSKWDVTYGLFIGWIASTIPILILGLRRLGMRLEIGSTKQWYLLTRAVWRKSAIDFLLTIGIIQGFILILSNWSSPLSLAAYRFSQTLMSPIGILISAIGFSVFGTKTSKFIPQSRWKSYLMQSAIVCFLCIMYIVVVSLNFDVLKFVWKYDLETLRAFTIPVGIFFISAAINSYFLSIIKSMFEWSFLLRFKIYSFIGMFFLSILGFFINSLLGFVWAMSIWSFLSSISLITVVSRKFVRGEP